MVARFSAALVEDEGLSGSLVMCWLRDEGRAWVGLWNHSTGMWVLVWKLQRLCYCLRGVRGCSDSVQAFPAARRRPTQKLNHNTHLQLGIGLRQPAASAIKLPVRHRR